MKNIFLISTDKESNLYEFGGKLVVEDKYKENFRSQFIYITNTEDIKENDYCYCDKYDIVFKYLGLGALLKSTRKVVLTNDTYIVEDGVQEVSSVFLSFYAENPVESVGLLYEPKNFFDVSQGWEYSIIFPQYGERVPKENKTNKFRATQGMVNYFQKESETYKDKFISFDGTNENFAEKEIKTEEKLYTKEDLEIAHQMGANFAYGRKEATKTNRLTHFED